MKTKKMEPLPGRSRRQRLLAEMKQRYYTLYHGDAYAFKRLEKILDERRRACRLQGRKREERPIQGIQAGRIRSFGAEELELVLAELARGETGGMTMLRLWQKECLQSGQVQALAEACREAGISLCLGIDLAGTGEDHPWAKGARSGNLDDRYRYFFFDDWSAAQRIQAASQMRSPGCHIICTQMDRDGPIVLTSYGGGRWILNYANPVVLNDMVEEVLGLAAMGVDAICLEGLSVLGMGQGDGGGPNLKKHQILRLLRLAVELVCPNVLLVGDGDDTILGSPSAPECHMVRDGATAAALWNTLATCDVRLLRQRVDELGMVRREQYVFFLRDEAGAEWRLDYGLLAQMGFREEPHRQFLNRWFTGRLSGSPARGELMGEELVSGALCGTTASLCGVESALAAGEEALSVQALNRLELMYTALFVLGGTTELCVGDEYARCNDYRYHGHPEHYCDPRYLHRGRLPVGQRDHPLAQNCAKRIAALQRRLSDHQALGEQGQLSTIDTGSSHVLGVLRRTRQEQVVVLLNFSAQAATAWLNRPGACTPLDGAQEIKDKRVELEPWGICWLRLTELSR